jgi:DNA-binding transcriptional LysR family regulator
MKFDIDSLRALQTVVDAGSVEAAADQLCISRSAVSWKLKRLQERTGCKLLEKEGRRLRLTEDGHELLAYGRQIIDIHDAAVRRFQPVNSPYVVRIGATEGAGSAPILDTVAPWFRRTHPDVELRIRVEQPAIVDEWLTDGAIDLAVTFALDEDVSPDDVVLASEDLVWAHSPGLDITELSSIPLITWGSRSFSARVADRVLTAEGLEHHVGYELPSSASVWAAITSGAGVTVADRAEIAHSDIATTGPPLLPELPRINYVLRRNPATAGHPLVRLAADQLKASFG